MNKISKTRDMTEQKPSTLTDDYQVEVMNLISDSKQVGEVVNTCSDTYNTLLSCISTLTHVTIYRLTPNHRSLVLVDI